MTFDTSEEATECAELLRKTGYNCYSRSYRGPKPIRGARKIIHDVVVTGYHWHKDDNNEDS